MKTIKKRYRIDRRQIGFLRFIFEGYEGLAQIKTIDPGAGLIEICIAPGCEVTVEHLLKDLKNDIIIEAWIN
jgi:hypothetical protein